MTRTLSITETMCSVCLTNYDTVEEAVECEILDMAEEEAELRALEGDAEYAAEMEQNHWEADDEYLTSLYGFEFGRP